MESAAPVHVIGLNGVQSVNINATNLTDYMSFNFTETTVTNATNVTNASGDEPENAYKVWQQALISIALGIIIIGTIIGNSLVCIAVAIVKRLQSPSNLLIVSLAVSDLLVAALVMPFAAVYELLGYEYWPFNDGLCDFFTSSDVIMCTASILNLCMISIDRYFVITRPFQYAIKRTPARMAIMIAAVWSLSVLISIPPMFGWKDDRPPGTCFISQKIGYQIYATVGAFYMPLIVMIVIYFRIWLVSSRIMKQEKHSKLGSIDRGNEVINLSHKSSRSSGASDHLHIPNGTLKNGFGDHDDATAEMLPPKQPALAKRRFTLKSLISRNTTKNSSSRERKATKTLGIIMGGFTLCWLPFFIVAVIRPFVGENTIPFQLISCLTWLGYCNSFMNPIIYARFNREFRTPFREILCFRCRGINLRLRSESYVEQYGPDQVYHRERDRDSLRPPRDSVVRYNSHGHTHVHVGNGNNRLGETKI
ncbi:tyramine receptor 1-like isoform X1 [Mya arenaria]|uniref:tyramine receptor 1-like isoform X1 n=1 Tax=Mya arenaria TaxID=6604 RepID=UPI0022E43664|nr:tyramine receptor 1-like isoform X1 [Mya arenaria]XP_052772127.1 tyramine receptor 1-like isoform X1 [Mya arenaria]XP_052772128.1 tyramine receptor 1-like isoform X1 [Mya arenaria]XP_052772129.1 tyramine receptor 1-like isoform X1 [Mya arenaria]XP_052772130.1 tyramine receptor 1-like isoform X1 [Mya arenaria]